MAEFEAHLGPVGHHVDGEPARELAHMHGAVGDVIARIARAGPFEPCLQVAQFGHEIAREVQGIDEAGRQRGMAGLPVAGGAPRGLAFVTGGDLHLRGLAHDAGAGLAEEGGEGVGHLLNADAADFLVMGEDELQRFAQVLPGGPFRGGEHAGEVAFHVGGAAAVEAVALGRQAEGVARPVLPLDGHHVGMAGEQDAAIARPGFGVEPGFLPAGIGQAGGAEAEGLQDAFDVVDDAQVAAVADRVEADQLFEMLHRACHIAPLKSSHPAGDRG